MEYKKLFFFISSVILISVVSAETSMNFLTKGYADTLYCQVNGTCVLDMVTIINLTVINQTVVNESCFGTECISSWSEVNITTNFSGVYVPYYNATGNVDLNDKNISLYAINSSQKCLNNSCIPDWSHVNSSTGTTGLVPYQGANQTVNLTNVNMTADNIRTNTIKSKNESLISGIEFHSDGNVTIWI